MNKFRNFFLGLLAVTFAFTSCSKNDSGEDIDYGNHLPTNYPSGYYRSTEGKTTAELKTALYNIIKGHRVRSYSQLWTDFRSTDARPDGRVWDIYSNSTRYQFGVDQDKGGGDANTYNREHSFPKSWFSSNTSSPMYTDLFHLYPSDSQANSKRSNNVYYEVQETLGKPSWDNGYCKLGKAVLPGVSNGQETVFEPNDEIKGDLARTYFYFATRYENENLNSWTGSKAITKTKYPFLSGWQSAILLKWHRQDPVSDKEVKRNEAIYKIQGNRNPFIDCPDMAEYIWGTKMGTGYHSTN